MPRKPLTEVERYTLASLGGLQSFLAEALISVATPPDCLAASVISLACLEVSESRYNGLRREV